MKGRGGGGGLLNSQTHGVKIWGFKNTLKTDKEKNQSFFFFFFPNQSFRLFCEEESVSGPEVLPLLQCWFICLSPR